MNREFELITFLKEPVRFHPKRWNLEVPFSVRWVYKSYGGRGRGRWQLFKPEELSPYKPFSDALVATLQAKGLLTRFCLENNRAFFLKDNVSKVPYEKFSTVDVYKRACK
jgi:hypothetical protein